MVSTAMPIRGIQKPIPSGLKPALGYIRVSLAREEMISPDLQRKAILQWAARTGHYIVDWVEDLDKTGRNFKRRIMDAVACIESGEVGVIAVWKFSRFGRSRYGQAINLQRIEHAGGQLLSATEDIDASTATGRLQRSIIMEFNAYESDRAAEQWVETHDHRRASGLPAVGRARFGYDWYPRKIPNGRGGWTVQEERYEPTGQEPTDAVNWAYDGYTAGEVSYAQIMRTWNLAGYTTGIGTPWTRTAVTGYMDSGFAAGLLYVHRREVHCPDRGECKDRSHMEHIPGAHEALIAPEKWEAYQELRARQLENTVPKRADSGYLFTGFTWCVHCHGRTQAQNTGRRRKDGTKKDRFIYWCQTRLDDITACIGGRIHLEDLEKQGHKWVLKVGDEIQKLALRMPIPELPEEVDDTAQRRKQLEADVSKYTAAMERAHMKQALADEPAPDDVHKATMQRLKKLRDEAQHALDQLPEPAIIGDPVDFLPIVLDLADGWEEMTNAGRRTVIAQLLRRVTMDRDGNLQWAPMWEPDPFPEKPETQLRKGSVVQRKLAKR
ncbi:recombinase family protein [Streptomyces sp. C36]|uniref:recombinase family protein n=1 Tax=Streptomyces sp. C36 TaxID=3237122 RepID=UPI0034C61F07